MSNVRDPNWKSIGIPVAAPSAPWTSSEAYDGDVGAYSNLGGCYSDGDPPMNPAWGKMVTYNNPAPFVIKGSDSK